MPLDDNFFNLGYDYLKVNASTVKTLNSIDWTKVDKLEISKKEVYLTHKKKLAESFKYSYEMADFYFSNAISLNTSYKNAYLYRAKLKSSDSILKYYKLFLNSYNYDKNYYSAILDYNKYLSLEETKNPEIEFNVIKLKFELLSFKSPLTKEGSLTITNDNLRTELNLFLDNNKEYPNAIELKVNLLSSEIDGIILRNEHKIYNTLKYKDLEPILPHSDDEKSLYAKFNEGILNCTFLLDLDAEKYKYFYHKRGYFNFLIGKFKEATEDQTKMNEISKHLSSHTYKDIILMTIESRREERDRSHQEYIEWASNECACGESPCACSDRDN